MASLKNLTFFKDGEAYDQKILGVLNGVVHHLRYQLDISADESGTELSFQIGGTEDEHSIEWVDDGGTKAEFDQRLENNELKFRCAISEDENAYVDARSAPSDFTLTVGKHPDNDARYIVKCDSVEHDMYPGGTYYLWLYPIPYYGSEYSWGRLQWASGLEEKLTLSGAVATYTVTYDANGGSGAPEAQTKDHGVDLVLDSKAPGRKGHTFLGWTDTADGKVVYQPGDTYGEDAAVTLYAVWKVNQYTDTFDPSGGIGGGSVTGDYGSSYPAPTATRVGYRISGWWSAKTGGKKLANPGQTITHNDKNETAYAQWNVRIYTISCDPKGGVFRDRTEVTKLTTKLHSNSMAAIGKAEKTPTTRKRTVTLDANGGSCQTKSLISSGSVEHIFTGWYDRAGTQVYDQEGQCVECIYWQDGKWAYDDDLQIYARYSEKPGQLSAVALPSAIRAGHQFIGWSTDPQAVRGFKGDYVPQDDVTLYAIWEEKNVTTQPYRILVNTRGRPRTFRALMAAGGNIKSYALYLEKRHIRLAATHDRAGNVTLHGDVWATHDGAGNVTLHGVVATEYKDGNVTIQGGNS